MKDGESCAKAMTGDCSRGAARARVADRLYALAVPNQDERDLKVLLVIPWVIPWQIR